MGPDITTRIFENVPNPRTSRGRHVNIDRDQARRLRRIYRKYRSIHSPVVARFCAVALVLVSWEY